MPVTEFDWCFADYRKRDLVGGFAHHKLGRRCYSICDSSEGDLDPSAEKVRGSSQVLDWFESGGADGEARRPEPQRAHSTVDNDNAYILSGPALNRASDVV